MVWRLDFFEKVVESTSKFRGPGCILGSCKNALKCAFGAHLGDFYIIVETGANFQCTAVGLNENSSFEQCLANIKY